MEPHSRATKLKRVTSVERGNPAVAVSIDAQRLELLVAPDQYIPFVTEAVDQIRFQRADRLDERTRYRFISEWKPLTGTRVDVVDLTTLTGQFQAVARYDDVHGHTFRAALPTGCEPTRRHEQVGYEFDPETFEAYRDAIESEATTVGIRAGPKHRPRPYRFDGGAFIELLGWIVTEGSIYTGSDRDTSTVQIAQDTPRYRKQIQKLLEQLEIEYYEVKGGFRFGSKLYGDIFAQLCGDDSRSKRLPPFVWEASLKQKRRLLETLLAGDGDDKRTYYTVSDQLAGQVLRLCVECGITPAYHRRDDWRVYCRHVPGGFTEPTHCSWVETSRPFYQVVVEDYPLVLAGQHGTFQWLAAAAVA